MILGLTTIRSDLSPAQDQILYNPTVPSLEDAFVRLLRLSSSSLVINGSQVDSSILPSQTFGKGEQGNNRGDNSQRGNRPKCNYCHKWGHLCERCYKLHG